MAFLIGSTPVRNDDGFKGPVNGFARPASSRACFSSSFFDCTYNLYDHSYSFASSEEELNKYIKQQQVHNKEIPKEESQFIDSNNNIHKYDATIRISPKAIENLKEINIIYKKIEDGEKLTEHLNEESIT